MLIRPLLAAALIAAVAGPALAKVRVLEATVPAPPDGAPTAAAYAVIESADGQGDVLLGAASGQARSVSFHQMSMAGDVMRMRALPSLTVPARGRLVVGPATGTHLMIVGLTKVPRRGESLTIRLTFKRAGVLAVPFRVTDPASARAP